MLMHTFADAHDFTGKDVHPFVTYAVSGLGTTEREYTRACPGANIGKGLAVQGETVRAGRSHRGRRLAGPHEAARPADLTDAPRGGMTGPPTTSSDRHTFEPSQAKRTQK